MYADIVVSPAWVIVLYGELQTSLMGYALQMLFNYPSQRALQLDACHAINAAESARKIKLTSTSFPDKAIEGYHRLVRTPG